MRTIAVSADGPAVRVVGETFRERVVVVQAPTYGRVLFGRVPTVFAGCRFRQGLELAPGTSLVTIIGCVLEAAS